MIRGSRRGFLAAGLTVPWTVLSAGTRPRHVVTLSFDDGFRRSFSRIATLYEKHGFSACLNVCARGKSFGSAPLGDFTLWNELQERGHEIMPHGYRHANLAKLPLLEARDLVNRCLDVFHKELKGFDARKAVFNMPFNAITPALEKWLLTRVRAVRAGGGAVNPLPAPSTRRLSCGGHGPGNAEAALDQSLKSFLSGPPAWFIFNTHGLDGEGWGPIGSGYLDRLLARLKQTPGVKVLPAGRVLQDSAST